MNILQIGCGNMGRAVFENYNSFYKDITILETKEIDVSVRLVLSFDEIYGEKFDIIIIAVKPQGFESIAKQIDGLCHEKTKIISIMAAIPLSKLNSMILKTKIFARVMPNLGISNGAGVSLLLNPSNNEEISDFCEKTFASGGNILLTVKYDNELDRITPLTGSGMAYFLLFADIFKLYAEKELKISEKTSGLILENILKSSQSLIKSGDFRSGVDKISSKGGITIAACEALKVHLENAVKSAMEAGFERAKEISES